MKPIRLFLKNIGPYRNQEIDFSRLDNMFLIRGNTGAGKTFIFDAMTFALYGELRGNRKGHAQDLKSRYASDDEESFVDFTFSLGNEVFKVHRTVPFKYIKRTGKAGNKISEVDFCHKVRDEFVSYGEKLEETNNRIGSLLGLNVDEFAQIVLLPQGAFAEFLKQNSKERTGTLQKLFPVSCYSNMMARIHDKYLNAQKDLELIQNGINTLLDGRDFSSAKETVQKLSEEIRKKDGEVSELIKKRETLASEITGLKRDLEDALEGEEKARRFSELLSKKGDYDALSEKLSLAEKANGLREFINTRNNLKEEKVSLEAKLLEAEKEFSESKKRLDVLEESGSEMEVLGNAVKKIFAELKVTEEKLESSAELESIVLQEKQFLSSKLEAEKSKLSIEEKLEKLKAPYEPEGIQASLSGKNEHRLRLEKEISVLETVLEESRKKVSFLDNLEKKVSQIEDLEKKSVEAEKHLSDLRESIEKLNQQIVEANQKGAAYSVAMLLKAGTPCPVCGSLEHPNPCEKPSDILSATRQLELQKNCLPLAEKNSRELQESLSEAKAEKKSIEKQLEEIGECKSPEEVQLLLDNEKNNCNRLIAEIRQLEKVQETVFDLEEELKKVSAEFSKVSEGFAAMQSRRITQEKNLGEPVENLRKKASELKMSYEKENGRLQAWEKDFKEAGAEFSASEEAVKQRRENFSENCRKLEKAENLLNEKLSSSIFETAEKALSVMMDPDQLVSKREELLSYEKDLKSAQDAVKDSEKLESSEKIKEKIFAAQEQAQVLNAEYESKNAELESKKAECSSLQKDYSKVQEKLKELSLLQEEMEPLKLLEDDLSGKNPGKLQFDAWALGMYFEQVVEFASVRFFDISNGRFEFRLKEISADSGGRGFKGLDLQVLDNFTGDLTDPSDLSGGETFEASISLALAVTDVVQNNSGGITLDSLFIDEGFGTLDSETLEKAMAVLNELGETKMIGIISHVEDLKNTIPSAIKVSKTKTGSSVEIV